MNNIFSLAMKRKIHLIAYFCAYIRNSYYKLVLLILIVNMDDAKRFFNSNIERGRG